MNTEPALDNGAEPVSRGFKGAARSLSVTMWISASIFAVYILVFYGGAIPAGTMGDWDAVLPHLYDPGTGSSVLAMGTHLLFGAVLLILGPIQFVRRLRLNAPSVHRWIGRVYCFSALAAGLAGTTFILIEGTVGGGIMSVGFGLYGVLMVVAAVQTVRHARQGRIGFHRIWAARLFALVIGSWLYRMDYGIWLTAAGGLGHTDSFTGPFDHVMDFFFYVPNLVVADLLVAAPLRRVPDPVRWAATMSICLVAGFTAIATVLFARSYWIPHIVARL